HWTMPCSQLGRASSATSSTGNRPLAAPPVPRGVPGAARTARPREGGSGGGSLPGGGGYCSSPYPLSAAACRRSHPQSTLAVAAARRTNRVTPNAPHENDVGTWTEGAETASSG